MWLTWYSPVYHVHLSIFPRWAKITSGHAPIVGSNPFFKFISERSSVWCCGVVSLGCQNTIQCEYLIISMLSEDDLLVHVSPWPAASTCCYGSQWDLCWTDLLKRSSTLSLSETNDDETLSRGLHLQAMLWLLPVTLKTKSYSWILHIGYVADPQLCTITVTSVVTWDRKKI